MEAKKESTQEKYQAMLDFYYELIDSEGPKAKHFSRSYFYAQVADKFFVTPEHASVVIRMMMNK